MRGCRIEETLDFPHNKGAFLKWASSMSYLLTGKIAGKG